MSEQATQPTQPLEAKSEVSAEASADSVSVAAAHDREIRPGEVADAVMFAMASGLTLDAERVDHFHSHVRRTSKDEKGELSAVSVVCCDPDPPMRLALHAQESQPAARRLLDLSLMKLRADGTRMIRVEMGETLSASLWHDAAWLEKLPDLTTEGKSRRWEEAMSDCSGDVIDVVQRALGKAREALRSLDRQTEAPPISDEK